MTEPRKNNSSTIRHRASGVQGLRRGGPGRKKGIPNKATTEVRAVATRLVDDPEYVENLRQRLIAGELPAAVEVMLWHYAKGKPKDEVEVSGAAQGPLVISWLPA